MHEHINQIIFHYGCACIVVHVKTNAKYKINFVDDKSPLWDKTTRGPGA